MLVIVAGVSKVIGPHEGTVFTQTLPVPANLAYERNYVDIKTSKGNFTMQTIMIVEQKYELQAVRLTNDSITWNVVMNINETVSGTLFVNVTRGSTQNYTFAINLNNANNGGVNKQNFTVPLSVGKPTDAIFYSMSLVSNSSVVWTVPPQYMALPDIFVNSSDWKLSKVRYILGNYLFFSTTKSMLPAFSTA